MIAVSSEAGICLLEFLDGRTGPSAAETFARRRGAGTMRGTSARLDLAPADAHLRKLSAELHAYFQ